VMPLPMIIIMMILPPMIMMMRFVTIEPN